MGNRGRKNNKRKDNPNRSTENTVSPPPPIRSRLTAGAPKLTKTDSRIASISSPVGFSSQGTGLLTVPPPPYRSTTTSNPPPPTPGSSGIPPPPTRFTVTANKSKQKGGNETANVIYATKSTPKLAPDTTKAPTPQSNGQGVTTATMAINSPNQTQTPEIVMSAPPHAGSNQDNGKATVINQTTNNGREGEEEEEDTESKAFKMAAKALTECDKPEFHALATMMSTIWENQKRTVKKVKSLEGTIATVEHKVNVLVRVTEVVEQRIGKTENEMALLQKDVAIVQRELNDKYVVIDGIPETGGKAGENTGEDTREIAVDILKDGGLIEISQRVVTAWRLGVGRDKKSSKQNQKPRLIIVKFDTSEARKYIMGKVKGLSVSQKYPQRMIYPKKSALELKGQYRLKAVFDVLTAHGWKLERKWGGFAIEGEKKVMMPLDFLQRVVVISSQEINVDEMVAYKNRKGGAGAGESNNLCTL
jgi:hypothetical protein